MQSMSYRTWKELTYKMFLIYFNLLCGKTSQEQYNIKVLNYPIRIVVV